MSGWNWDSEETKSYEIVPKSSAVAVYLNHSDELVIRQQGELGEEDGMIIIPTAYIEALVNAIHNAKPL